MNRVSGLESALIRQYATGQHFFRSESLITSQASKFNVETNLIVILTFRLNGVVVGDLAFVTDIDGPAAGVVLQADQLICRLLCFSVVIVSTDNRPAIGDWLAGDTTDLRNPILITRVCHAR